MVTWTMTLKASVVNTGQAFSVEVALWCQGAHGSTILSDRHGQSGGFNKHRWGPEAATSYGFHQWISLIMVTSVHSSLKGPVQLRVPWKFSLLPPSGWTPGGHNNSIRQDVCWILKYLSCLRMLAIPALTVHLQSLNAACLQFKYLMSQLSDMHLHWSK